MTGEKTPQKKAKVIPEDKLIELRAKRVLQQMHDSVSGDMPRMTPEQMQEFLDHIMGRSTKLSRPVKWARGDEEDQD